MSSKTGKLEPMPSLRSDAEAEAFVESADLSRYDLSGFRPMRFEFQPKSAAFTMRLPLLLLEALKAKAREKGIPYSRYVRALVENDLTS